MATRKIFNAATQQLEDAELTVDKNNEIVATFADGNFIKFPAGLDKKSFSSAISDVQKAAEGQEVITQEVLEAQAAERANSFALIGEDEQLTGDTTPEGDKTNAPTDTTDKPQ